MNLGDRVKDRISGFTGIVTGRAEYLYGCVQVLIVPESMDRDGKLLDSHWFDEERCELVAEGAKERPASAAVRSGGPLTTPAPPVR